MRRGTLLLVGLALAGSGGCFSPDETDDGADTGATTGDTSASMTAGNTTASTAPPTGSGDATGSGSGCMDECPSESAVCVGDDFEVCTVDPATGCRVLETETCAMGCIDRGCVQPSCGDGAIGADEECDDGDSDPGDGCDDSCAVEPGWECSGEPSSCIAPDLVMRIDDVVFDGDLIVTYTVANLGGLDSGDYDVELWQNRPGGFANPAIPGSSGQASSTKTSLAPLATEQFTDFVLNADFTPSVAFAVVDSDDVIAESDEANNAAVGRAWPGTTGELHATVLGPGDPVAIPDNAVQGGVMTAAVNVGTNSSPQVFFTVNVTHPSLADLTLEVTSPNAQTRVLAAAGDLTGSHLIVATFRDGDPPLSGGAAPYAGAFEPSGAWSGAIGNDANGTWTLRVVDGAAGSVGRINAFGVTVIDPTP